VGRPVSKDALVERSVRNTVRGAIKGGLKPGSFAVKVVDNAVMLLPCAPVDVQHEANPWDEVLPGAA
jgi:hypothetical protein